MPETETLEQAMDAMVAINAAVRNIRLYPPGSAMVEKSIQRVLPSLEAIMATEASLSFAESEKSLLVFDQPLGEKDQQKPQVASFLETLLNFGIKSITFSRGVGAEELHSFLDILSRKPEDVEADGGLQQLLPQETIPHILLDHKVYVAIKQDERVVSEDEADGLGTRRLLEKAGIAEGMDEDEISRLAHDQDRLAAIIQRGVAHITDTGEAPPAGASQPRLSEVIRDMNAQAGDEEKVMVSKEIAANLISMDPDTLAHVLSSEIEGQIGDDIIDRVSHLLDDEKFGKVAAKLKYAGLLGFMSRKPSEEAQGGEAAPVAAAAFSKLLSSEKGQRLHGEIDAFAQKVKQEHGVHFKSSVNQIIKGNISSLSDPAIMRTLAGTIDQLMSKNKMKTVDTLMTRLAAGLSSKSADTRTGAARVISEYAGRSIAENGAVDADAARQLAAWLGTETGATKATAEVFEEIGDMVVQMVQNGQFGSASTFLEPVHQIATGALPRDDAFASHCIGLIESLASDSIINALVDRLEETGEPADAGTDAFIGYLADKAASRLLEALAATDDADRQAAILQMVMATGAAGADELVHRMNAEEDTARQRKWITLLGKIGTAEHLPALENLLQEREETAERDVLNAIYTIGGSEAGDVLLNQLPTSAMGNKTAIIAMLGMLGHQPAVPALIQLLSPDVSLPMDAKAPIQEKACLALGKMGATEATAALETIVANGGKSGEYAESVAPAARKALAAIGKARDAAPKKKPAPKEKPAPKKAAAVKKAAAPAAEAAADDPEEAAAMALAADGNTGDAVKKLFDLIVAHARKKNFRKAEALRERLMEIDEMALTEIVKTAEIIEEEKSAALDTDHAELWQPFYDLLTGEEINALFYATEQVSFDPGQEILKQGQINDRLYFITHGEAQAVYLDGDNESILKTYEKGSVAGIHSFFNISVCKSSLVALSAVNADALPRSALAEWKDHHAGLETKLAEHLQASEDMYTLLEDAGVRRRHPRVDVRGKMLIQLVNSAGKAVGKPFKGDLADISLGGLCFYIKTSNSDAARTMLGRRLNMTFAIPVPSGPLKTSHGGRVCAVNYHMQNDYSVHVQFTSLLTGKAEAAVNKLTEGMTAEVAPDEAAPAT